MELFYITNEIDEAVRAEEAGVDRIFIDTEVLGKDLRQNSFDMVHNAHRLEDIQNLRDKIKITIMTRINPVNDNTADEIEKAVLYGTDYIMLPYFKSIDEVQGTAEIINGRVKFVPLVETAEAVEILEQILNFGMADEIHIGLNDLRLSRGKKFLFEPLSDGLLDEIADLINSYKVPWGFGGLACLGRGELPSDLVISEHKRLGSTRAILSRQFRNPENREDFDLSGELKKLRNRIEESENYTPEEKKKKKNRVAEIIAAIVKG